MNTRCGLIKYNIVQPLAYTAQCMTSKCLLACQSFSSKIINHQLHAANDKGESGIGYDVIIGHELMAQLGLRANFECQVLQWDVATVHMKESSGLLGKSDLNKSKMREVLMKTADPASTIEATERMVKNLNSTYAKADLNQVANNATQLNAEERTQLLSIVK